jgi:hypothetical protein
MFHPLASTSLQYKMHIFFLVPIFKILPSHSEDSQPRRCSSKAHLSGRMTTSPISYTSWIVLPSRTAHRSEYPSQPTIWGGERICNPSVLEAQSVTQSGHSFKSAENLQKRVACILTGTLERWRVGSQSSELSLPEPTGCFFRLRQTWKCKLG